MKKNYTFLLIFIFSIFNSVHAQPPGQWMWIHGSNLPNSLGNWGTIGIASPTNDPPAVYEPCEWKDHNGNFWIFGGWNPNGIYNAMWKYNPSNNQWTWMKGPNTTNSSGNYGVQGIPSQINNPPSRGWGIISWVDIDGNFWMFGGAKNNILYSDLWKYNIATNEWTWMKGPGFGSGHYGIKGIPDTANYPRGRCETTVGWTDISGDLWLFGGSTIPGPDLNDLWRYNISTNTWTWMKGSNDFNQQGIYGTVMTEDSINTPGARWPYSHWRDNCGNLWLFAGAENTGEFNDMWRYNIATNNWTWMGGSNLQNATGNYGTQCTGNAINVPWPIHENPACWTDQNGKFWNFQLNILLSYDPVNNIWTWVSGNNTWVNTGSWGILGVPSSSNHPNGRRGNMAWEDNSGHLYFFGGTNASTNGDYNDLWIYTIDPNCGGTISPTSVSVSNDTTICIGNCTTISSIASAGIPPYTYTWTPNIGGGAGPFTVCPSSTTTYTLHVTDSACTQVTTSVTIIVDTLTLTTSPSLIIYAGDSTMLSATGAATYSWSPCIYLDVCSGDSVIAFPPVTTTYIVTGTDSVGCVVMDSITVTVDSVPQSVAFIKQHEFYLAAYPNPFNSGFSFHIFNSSHEAINLVMYDVIGRKVETYNDVNESTVVGNDLRKGIYFVEARQGNNCYRVRVIKE